QAHLVDTDTESEPEEAPSKAEESQPLGSRVPFMGEEFEASEPSGTRTISSHSSASSDSITPLSLGNPVTQALPTPPPTRVSFYRSSARMAVRTQLTLSPGMSARIAEAAALSPSSFSKRYRSSYKIPSPSSSLTLPIQKRYRGTLEPVEDTNDESSDSDAERDSSEVVPVLDTAMSEPLGLGYEALRRHELALGEGSVPSTFEILRMEKFTPTYVPPATHVETPPSPEWSSGSLPVSPSSLVVPSHIASPVTTLAATISVDEDQFLEGYGRDLRELYTRSREARDELFSQRYMLKSLEREQERATVTFGALWRLVLALEAWARRVDGRMAEMSQARYDDHRLIHGMLVQYFAMQRELQEMRGRIATLEQEISR
nr:hypothetical protein [Tanacetum cinerariifolium]